MGETECVSDDIQLINTHMELRKKEVTIMKKMNIAGVTFNNKDGENRQGILAGLAAAGKTIIGIKIVKQNYTDSTTGRTSLALACVERTTGKQIGFIHQNEIADILSKGVTEMTGFIGYNTKGKCYFVEIDTVQAPSRNQYILVKNTCKRAGIEAPAYDVRAYKRWFKEVMPALALAENK